MKKFISIVLMFCIIALMFSINVYAAPLPSVTVDTDKTTIRPGEEVKVNVNFGQDLGAYTVDVHYDDALFQYISAEGGTASDDSDKVRVVFHDSSGGTNPRTSMSVTFKAKAGITTSNPTEFTVTAEGLANADASVNYDDITTPIVKNVTVEPVYVDYDFSMEYTGSIVKDEPKNMTISYFSPLGRYYEHARLIAEATTPDGASVTLIGKDQSQLEHDIIQSGWGDAQGSKIGGEDVSQVLNVQATFSKAGSYTITLKLIDRDNSDTVIAQKAFDFTVNDAPAAGGTTDDSDTAEDNNTVNNETIDNTTNNDTSENEQNENITNNVVEPTKLPKTGSNIYIPIIIILAILVAIYVYYNVKKNK